MATSVQLKNMLTQDAEPGPFISIVVPYSGANPVEFKRLVDSAKRSLARQVPKQSWKPYQNQLNHLELPRFSNHNLLKGFVIYLGPTILRVFQLSYSVHPVSVVNDTMWIIPLIIENQFKRFNYYQSVYKRTVTKFRTRYQTATARKLTSDNFLSIIKMAPAGLIDTLLINQNVSFHVKKILNDLAITTIGFGGQVFVLPAHRLTRKIPAIVIKRK